MNLLVWLARLLFAALALVVAIAIVDADTGSSNFVFDALRPIRYGDKYGHFVLYGLMAFLLHIALRGAMWRWWRLAVPVAAVLVLAFGIAEEISQLYNPLRTFDLIDIASNFAGVILFTLLAHGLWWWLQRQSSTGA